MSGQANGQQFATQILTPVQAVELDDATEELRRAQRRIQRLMYVIHGKPNPQLRYAVVMGLPALQYPIETKQSEPPKEGE